MTEKRPDDQRAGVQVIARAAQILRALDAAADGVAPVQLSNQLELPRSTVHRILTALEEEDLVASVATGRYQLGPALLRMGSSRSQDLRNVARPFMEELSMEVDETVDLAILVREQILFIDQVTSRQRLGAVSAVGATFPAHCTANGKALLAEFSDEALRELLPKRLPSLTGNTSSSRSALLSELKEVRVSGVAVDREEHTIGISAVGAAIKDHRGPVGALTIPVPSLRFDDKEPALRNALLRTCRRVSEVMGGSVEITPVS